MKNKTKCVSCETKNKIVNATCDLDGIPLCVNCMNEYGYETRELLKIHE